MSILEVAEGLLYQTSDERLAYSITTTEWVSSPTSSSVTAYDEASNTDVTSTGGATGNGVFPSGSPSEDGDVINLPLLRDLTAGHTYRIEVQFTVSSNVWECYFRVKCEV